MMNQQGPGGRLVAGGPLVMTRQVTRRPLVELALVVVFVSTLMGRALPAPLMRTTPEQTVLQANTSVQEEDRHTVLTEYARVPLSFMPNAGQTDMRVRFYAHGSGYRFYFTPEAAVLAFAKQADGKDKGLALYLRFLGGNPTPEIEGIQKAGGTVNYFVGSDPAKWHSGLPTYHAVVYRDLWPGIDMLFRSQDGRLKYEFHLAPGANPNDIQLAYVGAESLSVNAAGSLLIDTPLGILTDARPVADQHISGRKVQVESHYVLTSGTAAKHSYGFALGAYDARYPLVIDPGLAYSTYLGGTGSDTAVGLAVDREGNAYIAGGTAALDFPTTPGTVQSGPAGGGFDAYVAKLNPSGSALVYSTYLGGSGFDFVLDLALDKDGHAYVVGFTDSGDFPTTPGAFQPADPGPGPSPQGDDGFVTKLHPSGSALVYSTYLGGVGEDTANSVEVGEEGHAYVGSAGATSSFPTTAGAFQETDPGPTPPDQVILGQDVIISKLNESGSALIYATYLGGSARDILNSMAIDADGNVYAAGATDSVDFPTTPGAFQRTDPQPVPPGPITQPESGPDGFVSKLNRSGSALVYSTYLGGTGGAPGGTGEGIIGIGVDRMGQAYVTGRTDSLDFPTTRRAFDTTYNGGPNDGFVTKFNRSGSALLYSTYLGGSGDEEGGRFTVALDEDGNAYITSETNSPDFPVTPDAIQTSLGGSFDVYVTVLNPSGSALRFSTYLGGSGFELPNSIALGRGGHVYVVGRTRSNDFPTTEGAFQSADPNPTPGGAGQDAFVTKIRLGP